jgi:hypothetical protein
MPSFVPSPQCLADGAASVEGVEVMGPYRRDHFRFPFLGVWVLSDRGVIGFKTNDDDSLELYLSVASPTPGWSLFGNASSDEVELAETSSRLIQAVAQACLPTTRSNLDIQPPKAADQ